LLLALTRLRRYPATLIGIAIVGSFVLTAVFGSLIAPYGYTDQVLADRLQPPSGDHVFGTDQFGRDIFSRVLVGSRDVFLVAGTGTLVAVLLGLTLGLLAGYFGGLLDEFAMRLVDVLLAVPP